MVNSDKVEKIISENIHAGFFTGGTQENVIKEIENRLGVTLPNSYKWFLLRHGSGGVFGVDIIGVGKSNQACVVIETEKKRKLGLNKELVVIEDCDEYIYCLDTSKLSNGECPVISWDEYDGYDSIESNNFYEFLLDRLVNSKDAWGDE
jgi:SMI1 / KNR4 family.